MDGKIRKFRIAAVAVCLSAALAMTGCAASEAISAGKPFGEIMTALKYDLFGSDDQNCRQLDLTLPVREGFRPIGSKAAFASLRDETMKDVYREIEKAIFQISPQAGADGR